MKRIIILLTALLIVCSCVFVAASADGTETPDYTQMSDIERLARGIIYVSEDMTLEDFYQTMRLVDESEGFINTDKFIFFCYMIEELYYIPLTAEEAFRLFAERTPYVDTNDMDEVYKNLFAILDKYSYYIPADNSETFWSPNAGKGVGITFVYDSTGEAWGQVGTYIEGVAKGSSADAAGIRTGDRLIAINNIDVTEMPFSAVSALLASIDEDAEYVELIYERIEGEYIITSDVTLARTSVNFREITFHLYPEKRAFLIKLDNFRDENTPVELVKRLKELREAGYVNAILDLRNNPGGDVVVAADIISAFIEEDTFLFSMGREGKKNYYNIRSTGNGVEFDTLHVLVNSRTASCAEITALCLQQHANATLVGERTVGKAVAQSASKIIDGSTFGITTFVAYDYMGKTYNEKGILPRLCIENTSVKFDFPTDLEWFNYINYVQAVEGAENDVVTALERRLELMGLIRSDFVDGVWDEHTTASVKVLQIAEGQEPTGKLNPTLVQIITDVINGYKNISYERDLQLETVFSNIF